MDFRPINVLISSLFSQQFGETSIDLNAPDIAFSAVRFSDRVMRFNRAESRWETPTHRPLEEDFDHEANNVGDPIAFAEGFKFGAEIASIVVLDPLGTASIGGILKRAQSAHIQNLSEHRGKLLSERDAKNAKQPNAVPPNAAPQAESVVRDRGGAFDALANYWLRRIDYADGREQTAVPECNLEFGAGDALEDALNRRGVEQKHSGDIAAGFTLGLEIARILERAPLNSEQAIRAALDSFVADLSGEKKEPEDEIDWGREPRSERERKARQLLIKQANEKTNLGAGYVLSRLRVMSHECGSGIGSDLAAAIRMAEIATDHESKARVKAEKAKALEAVDQPAARV